MATTPYWTMVIQNAKKRLELGEYPFSGIHITLAHSWTTCACGEQDDRIKRDELGKPKYPWLVVLGENFFHAVRKQNPVKAEKILAEIEDHVAMILEEIDY